MSDLIDTTEMYLKAIFELDEDGVVPMRARIAERLGHSGPTVSQTVARMERDGLLTLGEDRHLAFTDLGRSTAVRVMRKHRLAERLLIDVIGLEPAYVHDEACRWEHVMSDRVESHILPLIADRRRSPYGNPIPGLAELGGALADDAESSAAVAGGQSLAALLGDGQETRAVQVVRIGEPAQVEPDVLGLLLDSGVTPGAAAQVRREGERYLVAADGGEAVNLPLEVATHLFVEAAT